MIPLSLSFQFQTISACLHTSYKISNALNSASRRYQCPLLHRQIVHFLFCLRGQRLVRFQ